MHPTDQLATTPPVHQGDWKLYIEKDGVIIGHYHESYGAFIQGYWGNRFLIRNFHKKCTSCGEPAPSWLMDLLALAGRYNG